MTDGRMRPKKKKKDLGPRQTAKACLVRERDVNGRKRGKGA